jgi:hypothetical protein
VSEFPWDKRFRIVPGDCTISVSAETLVDSPDVISSIRLAEVRTTE